MNAIDRLKGLYDDYQFSCRHGSEIADTDYPEKYQPRKTWKKFCDAIGDAFPAIVAEVEAQEQEIAALKEKVEELEYANTLQAPSKSLLKQMRELESELAEARKDLRQAVLFATELEGFHFGINDVCESEKRTGKPCPSYKAFHDFIERNGGYEFAEPEQK